MLTQKLSVTLIALGIATGCAKHMALLPEMPTSVESHEIFWPPPSSTSIWTPKSRAPATFGDAAARFTRALHSAGYDDTRWYPIGIDYAHGFAVATRLERVDADARPTTPRWASLYPEASNLFWLEHAREPRLSGKGRYRVILIALTDMPIGESHVAPRWNDESWMDGPEAIAKPIPPARVTNAGYRIGFYVYEYESRGDDGDGAFIAVDAHSNAEAHVRAAGLSILGDAP